jgi:hypothetical protein
MTKTQALVYLYDALATFVQAGIDVCALQAAFVQAGIDVCALQAAMEKANLVTDDVSDTAIADAVREAHKIRDSEKLCRLAESVRQLGESVETARNQVDRLVG